MYSFLTFFLLFDDKYLAKIDRENLLPLSRFHVVCVAETSSINRIFKQIEVFYGFLNIIFDTSLSACNMTSEETEILFNALH